MTTGGSGNNNESIPQEDSPFQQEMERIGARVPPGRMGNVKDLASVSQSTPEPGTWQTMKLHDVSFANPCSLFSPLPLMSTCGERYPSSTVELPRASLVTCKNMQGR